MKTLLRIDASARNEGSHSRRLADVVEAKWRGNILRRDVAVNAIPHLSDAMIGAFHEAGRNQSPETAVSDALIAELKQADHLLISTPLYNYSLPSTLKAYLDHVVRSGHTFQVENGEYQGLLMGKTATVIMARGSMSGWMKDDFQSEYLKEILAFMGIGPVEVITINATQYDEEIKRMHYENAKQQAEALFPAHEPEWAGEFSAEDKAAISAIRQGQANAIMAADSEAYAALCADDIQLMVPGHDIVSGKEAFIEAELNLFRKARFEQFTKMPVKVERQGDFAVETGRQDVVMKTKGAVQEGVFAAKQKYLHIYRLTSDGWRYAVLMSNQVE